MLQTLTFIKIIDNSGVKLAQCIRVLNKKTATVGDFIIITVKAIKKKTLKIKKKEIFKVLIVNTKKETHYKNNFLYKFNENQGVVVTKTNTLIGTRFFGIIPKTLRSKKNIKLLLQALYII